MATIYRIIEHKDHPCQESDLDKSLGGASIQAQTNAHYARGHGISELYRGVIQPSVLQPGWFIDLPNPES